MENDGVHIGNNSIPMSKNVKSVMMRLLKMKIFNSKTNDSGQESSLNMAVIV